jgi:hypothetical protein
MKLSGRPVALGLLVLLIGVYADGQKNRKGLPGYDAATEFTFDATIEQVNNHRCGKNWSGTHLMVTLEGRPHKIHLGPAVFIKEQAILFRPGDRVTVTGSRIPADEGHGIVAREVRKGEQRLVLRDQDGRPSWSAQRWQW